MNSPNKRSAGDRDNDEDLLVPCQIPNSSDSPAYPRKRVALACEVCRLRKTRCDAARPSCSFCRKLDIECVYRGPSKDDRPRSDGDDVLSRLHQIDSSLKSISALLQEQQGTRSLYENQPQHCVPRLVLDQATPFSHLSEPSVPSPAATILSTSRQATIPRMPNLFTFEGPAPWSYDCTAVFFADQLACVTDLCTMQTAPNIDLKRPHLWRLQQSFVENVLKWMPLFDEDTVLKHLQNARISNHEVKSPSLSLVFLMYAIGTLALDTNLYSVAFSELPGIEYYMRALDIIKDFPPLSTDLCVLQCRTLEAIYFLYAMRPLQSWNAINQASQNCTFLLRSGTIKRESYAYLDAFRRIYWICYIIDSELEICLEVPTSGLKNYETLVTLPSSHYEEEGMYCLLALTSLRKLMVEVVSSVSTKGSMFATYAPRLAVELRKMIDEWCQHLPTSLSFPPDHSLLFDKRRAYLRCQYHALIVVVFWPFIAKNKELSRSGTRSYDEESDRIQMYANECLIACRNFLNGTEELLLQKTIDSHVIVRSYFTLAVVLLLVFDTDDESDEALEDKLLLEYALENLSHWKVVPFFKRSIDELERMAAIKGLALP